MKRKVIFLQKGKEIGCAMLNTLSKSPDGIFGIANVDGRKISITKCQKKLVVQLD